VKRVRSNIEVGKKKTAERDEEEETRDFEGLHAVELLLL
jgi:hypothetical protein